MFDYKKLGHLLAISSALTALFACNAYALPESPFAASGAQPLLLAHRGMSQTFSPVGVTNDTCTATRMNQPTHNMLENTLSSMAAAVAAGADVIEIDVHPTTDGQFAVFHDWTLECRTNSSGRTRDFTMTQLKQLDLGYGYTADDGKTFPFRGKIKESMPSLTEVLQQFPNLRVLINIKSNDPAEGLQLATYLNGLTAERRALTAVYGGDKPVQAVRDNTKDIITMSKSSLKTCLISYLVVGWSGQIPSSCEKTLVLLPINYADWMWGWPNRFVERMRSAGSAVFVAGPYSGGANTGIDTVEALKQLPADFKGGIWTNEIELIGEALKAVKKP
jgi:glycerophosphoryl diester phosphodiesterase